MPTCGKLEFSPKSVLLMETHMIRISFHAHFPFDSNHFLMETLLLRYKNRSPVSEGILKKFGFSANCVCMETIGQRIEIPVFVWAGQTSTNLRLEIIMV